MSTIRTLITLGFTWLVVLSNAGSHVGDSLRYRLDADASMEDRARALIAMAERTLHDSPSTALGHALNALRCAEKSPSRAVQHDALVMLRTIQLESGMHAEYLRSTTRSLDVAKSIGDSRRIAQDLQALSYAYQLNERADRAVEEARNALAVIKASQEGGSNLKPTLFLMRALLHAERHDEVIKEGTNVLKTAKWNDDPVEQERVRLVMARSHILRGEPDEAYPHLTQVARVLERHGDAHDRFLLAICSAQCEIASDRSQDASWHLDVAEALLPLTGDNRDRNDLVSARIELARHAGEWEHAFHLLEALRQYEDSVHDAAAEMALAGAQVMFEVDRKEKDLGELRNMNKKNERLIELQRADNRWLLVGLAVLLLLAIALFIITKRSMAVARRSKLKSAVIERQKDEIHTKNLELQRQNMRLAETLVSEEQKDIVIKEIHHRVKNNLQVIDGLLTMEYGNSQDPEAVRFLKDAQGRIRAMALVHNSMFRTTGERPRLRDHLQELARNVLAAHGRHDSISLQAEIDEIALTPEELMPLSLLVNELLTNSIKYAFAPKEHGIVRLSLQRTEAGVDLTYSDNGSGFGMGSGALREGSFGMQLIQALAIQLNGRIRLLEGSGTTLVLSFADEQAERKLAS